MNNNLPNNKLLVNKLRLSMLSPLRVALGALALVALIAMGQAAHAKRGNDGDVGGGDQATAGEILLRLRSATDYPALAKRYGLVLKGQFGTRPIYRTAVAGATDVDAVAAALELEPGVIQVDRNYVHTSPEARGNSAWAVGTAAQYVAQWAPQSLRLDQAHAMSIGVGARVAVLDSGIDFSHPAFAGRLLPGYDFVDGDRDPSESTPGAGFGHGTHVAGLVAMVAPGAKIMPLRVLDADGSTNAWVIGEAMLYAMDPDGNPATDDGAHVINLSLGSTGRTEILDAVARLSACAIPEVVTEPSTDFTDPGFNLDKQRCALLRGAAVIAAAGNDSSESLRQYPAAEGAYGLLSVTASDSDNRVAEFANYGGWIDLAAPGKGLTAPMAGGGYATWSGTSMAAGVVSGAAALLAAREPQLTARDITRRLERAAAVLCGDTKMPRLDALAVLQNASAPSTACR